MQQHAALVAVRLHNLAAPAIGRPNLIANVKRNAE